MREILKSSWKHWALLVLIIGVGFYARVWGYRTVPSGLNQDEAENGVEAMSLYRYGVDRNGVSFPTRFISWGSGTDALYAYTLIPLIAVVGLTPTVVRLPMLVFGILSLPLVYYIGQKLRGRDFGLLAMFLLAISPWHIVISRRAHETDLFPFLFLLGFACLLKTEVTNHWFALACFVLGVSLYAYWTAYLIVPLFALIAIPSLYAASRVSFKDLVAGIFLLMVLAAPAALYMIINMLDLPSIHLGLLTIPRFPSVSRINTEVAVLQPAPLQHFLQNVAGFFGMIIVQSNGPIVGTSTGYPYGYLYRFTFPLILAGAVVFFKSTKDVIARRLLLAWLVATAVLGLIISPLFGHNNVLIFALILMCAASLEWLMTWNKTAFILSLAVFMVAFALFTGYSHGTEYRELVQQQYYEGLLPALDYARSSTAGPICVNNTKILQPEIFVLLSEKAAPSVEPDKIVYIDPSSQFREARSVGRYFFGSENCPLGAAATYVLTFKERPPVGGKAFTAKRFEGFEVFVPK